MAMREVQVASQLTKDTTLLRGVSSLHLPLLAPMTPHILDMGMLVIWLLGPKAHRDEDGSLRIVNFWIWW